MSARNPGTGRSASGRPNDRYNEPSYRRTALVPGVLAAIILLAGFALLGTEGFLWIQYPVAILALIQAWFAFQARQWWWIPPLVAIAVLWNPVFPFAFEGTWWLAAQYVAVLVFVVSGALIKIPVADEERHASGRR